MRFQNKNELGEIPEVDITPMLNVIMVVLAFFVVVSTTLTGEPETVKIDLPNPSESEAADEEAEDSEPPPVLRVNVAADGTMTVDDRPYQKEEVLAIVPAYIENNPESLVYLIPDPDLPYEQVIQMLAAMRDVGGDRISLAVGNGKDKDETEEVKTSEE
ncbi:biopolymer transporter ExbD [Oscillatoriales cyanobacterium LEGE 11467]|uniref:Biopolymer transporter ExbD n=1 Tax=Zarconia navalis LEGE 11467 TaxID=1828826 RepID=A0A928VU12_9CYAN|nr:biopolymer transporter ExbD [Zarconia navalis]MBE9039404.1 biopolymer transporter ExbD [Zarconia navalis LEGE 11467]